MARGGRSPVAAIIGTVIAVAVVGAIVWAAWPLMPVIGDWIASTFVGFFDWLRSVTPERS